MASRDKPAKVKETRSHSRASATATLRSTSGAGFEFEDLIAAWQLVKALSGEQAPAVDSVATQLQAQVSALGWRIDDLLLTSETGGVSRRLAMSVKGNQQVSASGLPGDFLIRAWEQWRDVAGPFNQETDALALVTLGTNQGFGEAWREVKNACAGTDVALTMSRIRANARQARIFDGVAKAGGPAVVADAEVIELIRRLHVLPTDLQFAFSETENQAIAQCRQLLASGELADAQELWNGLVAVARQVRVETGTIKIQDLWALLRVQFGLRHHPDFARDWETISNITADRRLKIVTELPSGYAVPRTAQKEAFRGAVEGSPVTVVFGESGSGKSALVKSVLDTEFPGWNQVWFGPEELKVALSAARRGTLPLRHELGQVLNATVRPANVLVIDAAEHIEAAEFVVIRQLINAILPVASQAVDSAWRVVVVTQTHGWVDSDEALLGGRTPKLVEVEPITADEVKLALLPSPSLGWLAGHDETIAALTNLRTLAWVVRAGSALGSNASGLASHTAIADRLWKFWTKDRPDVQALMMRLAEREAAFERSFALTDLDPSDTKTFTERPVALPLLKNDRTNRVEFEHDLAADWSRFQFLKQFWADTARWARFAGNPLWANALRMLGQFLLRQSEGDATAWDKAFREATAANNDLAGNILLDALCLDPEAERLLGERTELLFAGHGEVFERLLQRFHHIATVPIGGPLDLASTVGLYMEAQYRSIIFGRWPPVLTFFAGQAERLGKLVSPSLAKVIQTWLTGTPQVLSSGMAMPYRREMAEIVLAMARTVQVEKGHGVMYLTRDHTLYTAALAAAADLPTEVGAWALELAGRRPTDAEVTRRIAEVRRQQAQARAKRLEEDPEYRAREEARSNMPRSLGIYRDRLPPWPLGASGKVDMDFRQACFKDSGIQPLMRACPEVAAEVLLALIIEDKPERDHSSHGLELDLGLDYAHDAYPTAFWKSPFFPFLAIAPNEALGALIALVNFCTERWAAEVMRGRGGEPPGVTLKFADGSEKTFVGWWQVFGWPQANSMHQGNLFNALDALERWLTQCLDNGVDISAYADRIFRDGNSTALLSVLVNVAKYRPLLLSGPLGALITSPNIIYWDGPRVTRVEQNFIAWSWAQSGEAMFEFARSWTLAPHRTKTFLDEVVERLKVDVPMAERLQTLLPNWSLPTDAKEALEFKLIYAALDRANYQAVVDPETGQEILGLVYPEALSREVQAWQADHAKPLTYLVTPMRCEERLQGGQLLEDGEAEYLYELIKACETEDAEEDADAKAQSRIAAAATLVVLGSEWLEKTAGTKSHVLGIIRDAIAEIPTTSDAMRSHRIGSIQNKLKFAAHAAMHMWLSGDEGANWESAILHLLTSGDGRAAATVVNLAHAKRDQLGSAWWRLLMAGTLWSGLILLSPHHGDNEAAERVWAIWLARLRRFRLRGVDATPDDLDFKRIAAGRGRLEFDRAMRLYASGDREWRGEPERRPGVTLDGHILEGLFGWLIDGDGTGDRAVDTRLLLRLWDYEASRAKARGKTEKNGEYDLPTQHLGYDLLLKFGTASLAAPEGEQRALWEPILEHGPAAHYAVQHFIRGLFLRLSKGDAPAAFETLWRPIVEYGLAANWSQPGLWFYGERLLCDLLGFGNEDSLARLGSDAALKMKDAYARWAETHLSVDEENVTRFAHFLTTNFGAPLRLDGLRWIASMLRGKKPSDHWYREGTGTALVELVAAALGSDAQELTKDALTLQALVEIAAALAAKNITAALALQERIKRLR